MKACGDHSCNKDKDDVLRNSKPQKAQAGRLPWQNVGAACRIWVTWAIINNGAIGQGKAMPCRTDRHHHNSSHIPTRSFLAISSGALALALLYCSHRGLSCIYFRFLFVPTPLLWPLVSGPSIQQGAIRGTDPPPDLEPPSDECMGFSYRQYLTFECASQRQCLEAVQLG